MLVREINGGFGFEQLRQVERPDPVPGPGEVVVRVLAAALNYRDLMVIKGQYNPKMPLPRVPLSDAVGQVEAVGPGVTRVQVGQRVAGIFMQTWLEGEVDDAKSKSALGGAIDGVLAEKVLLHESGLVSVPEHLTDAEAATLPCAAVTAWHALVHAGGVKAGDSVLIQGTGGVSLFALQFAKLLGAGVIGTSSSEAKLARAKELGLSDGVNYKSDSEWGETVRRLSGGRGVDHVVEVGGAGTMPQSLRAVRMHGTISLIGVLTGASQFNPTPVLMKNIRMQGIYVGSRAMFEAMNRAITLHKMRPIVDRVFPFAETVEAYRYLESGAHFGKVVIAL